MTVLQTVRHGQQESTKAAGGVLAAKQAPAGPASPRRWACAPGRPSPPAPLPRSGERGGRKATALPQRTPADQGNDASGEEKVPGMNAIKLRQIRSSMGKSGNLGNCL